MTQRKILPDGQSKRIQSAIQFLGRYQLGTGVWVLIGLLTLTSFIVTFEWGQPPRVYVQGEIAEHDIMADRSFSFRDNNATKARRESVQKAQPLICTLNTEPVDAMHERVRNWFIELGKAEGYPVRLEKLRLELSDTVGEELSLRQITVMSQPEFQHYMGNIMLPWAEQRLRDGVIADARKIYGHSGGIIIRDLQTGVETLHQDTRSIPDLKDYTLEMEREVRTLPTTLQVKRLISAMLTSMSVSTLSPNEEATRQLAADAAKSVQPVVQHISEGEIIVRQGEKIDADQLVKLQALWKRNIDRFKPQLFTGVLFFSLLTCVGLFFSTSDRQMNNIRQKDLVFIGCLTLIMALMAKAFYLIGFTFSTSSFAFTAGAQAFAVPVAGAVALTGLALNNKRYYITCMLVSFFCTIVCKGGIGLFLFYYMSGMLCTWLVIDSQNRKEVVWALLPLTGGLIAIWLGASLLQGGEYNRFLAEGLALLLGSLLSIVIIFAFSPIVEMAFGYTTRFVLMELLNQEHPVLRQLMLEAPGTYHHSIIVANMVEPAAKAIGAHSLLAKVGAIYHDIGKIDKAEYFIENQFQRANPHDRINPTMSALVLISHVKRGTELAAQYKLGREITDIIGQHHGNSLIRYFYHKAKAIDPMVNEASFCYAGPRPQSREAALIMLADVVEASSRTLEDPTPSRIKAHVHKIIRSVLADGQLENTELTLTDLDKVADSFVLILTGIFHKRIEYPDKVPPKPTLPDAHAAQADPEINYHTAQWIDTEETNGKAPEPAKKSVTAQARHVKMPSRGKRIRPQKREDAAHAKADAQKAQGDSPAAAQKAAAPGKAEPSSAAPAAKPAPAAKAAPAGKSAPAAKAAPAGKSAPAKPAAEAPKAGQPEAPQKGGKIKHAS